MEKECQYRYFIYKERLVARLDKTHGTLEQKEFFMNGRWESNEKLNLMLNDCMMDFGGSRWYEYEEIPVETALKFLNNQKSNE